MAFRVWGVEALQLTVRPILQGSFAPFPSQTWSPPKMSSIILHPTRPVTKFIQMTSTTHLFLWRDILDCFMIGDSETLVIVKSDE